MQESTFVKMVKGGAIVAIAGVVVTIGGFKTFEKVDNGNVGIEYSMSGGVRDKAIGQGVHWVGLDKVTQYPVKTQSVKQRVSLATSDGKKTDVDITYSYHVDTSKAVNVYKKFGSADVETIEKGWLQQNLQKAGREAMSNFTLLEVVGTDSSKVQAQVLKNFQKQTEQQGFVIEDLSFGVPSIDPQTQKSIDAIIKAGQDNKRAELEAKTKNTKAEASAKAKITKANAEAKANEVINNSINDKTIDYMTAQARIKNGWYVSKGGAIVDAK